jgi:thymidylate synthase (FAD)
MVNLVMEIKTTRDIGRQILRHDFKFQEFSQRYAKVDTSSFVLREARFQDLKNRQNSIPIETILANPEISVDEIAQKMWVGLEWADRQSRAFGRIQEDYEWAIEHGIAKEQARVILPEGNTMSCMYMQGTLRNWFHYSLLRMAEGTQREHQDIAEKAWVILKDKFEFLREIEIENQH